MLNRFLLPCLLYHLWKKYLLRSCVHVSIRLFAFRYWIVWALFKFWVLHPVSDIWFRNISYSLGSIFILLVNVILPLLPSCWGFSFVLGHGVSFFGGIQHFPVDGCSASRCELGVLTGEDERTSFYSTFLNLKHPTVSTQAAGALWGVIGCEQLMVFPLGSQSPGGSPLHHGASMGLSLPPLSQASICYWRRAEKYLRKAWRGWAKAKTTPSCGCD